MPKSDKDDKPSGELRRRWEAFRKDGSLASLRSEGRLVALYVFMRADWTTCQLSLGARSVARKLCVQPTSVRRGLTQLVEANILRVLRKGVGTVSTRFEVVKRTRAVSTPDTSRDPSRAQGVSTLDTSGAQPSHEPCPERARVVSGVRTRCDPYQSLSVPLQ